MLPASQAGHPCYSVQHMEKLKHIIMVMQRRELPRPKLASRDRGELPRDRLEARRWRRQYSCSQLATLWPPRYLEEWSRLQPLSSQLLQEVTPSRCHLGLEEVRFLKFHPRYKTVLRTQAAPSTPPSFFSVPSHLYWLRPRQQKERSGQPCVGE